MKPAVTEFKQISLDHQQLLIDLLRQYLAESTAMNAKPSTHAVEADPRILSKLLRQYVSENTGSPLPAQSGSSVEKFLSKIENGANMQENKLKVINNNESYVSSTSLDFPEAKQHLTAMNNLTETMSIQSQVAITNDSTVQLKQGIAHKDIANESSSNSILNSVVPSEMPMAKPKESNFQVNASMSLQEVSTSISNPHDTKMMVPSLIDQVIMPTSAHDAAPAVTNQETLLSQTMHEPVIDILNSTPLMMQDVITTASSSFDSQVNNVQINTQLLSPAVPCISDSMVQPMVVTPTLMEGEGNILASTNTSVGLLNTTLVDSRSQFQQQQSDVTLTTATVNASLMSIPVVGINSAIPQVGNILPALNQPELVSEAHIMNTQLDQLLTTDIVSDDPTTNSVLNGGGNSPLVRDVLLGSGVTSAPILTTNNVLDIHPDPRHKKTAGTEGMLPQELTHMSEKDLLSYINPGCFDQGRF